MLETDAQRGTQSQTASEWVFTCFWLPGQEGHHRPLGQNVGLLWRTQRLSLSLFFINILFFFFPPDLLVNMIFSLVSISALVLNHEEKTWEISSPQWFRIAWQCVPTLKGLFFFPPIGRTKKGNSKPQLRLGHVIYNACALVYGKEWPKPVLGRIFCSVRLILFMTGR